MSGHQTELGEPRPPIVRGALVAGPAAYALSRAIDRHDIETRLVARGFGERWVELALAALEAIDLEAATWRREREARRAIGSSEVPSRAEAASSAEMATTLTTNEAADALNVSDRRVRQLIDNGALPATRDGWAWQLDAAAVAHFASNRDRNGAGCTTRGLEDPPARPAPPKAKERTT